MEFHFFTFNSQMTKMADANKQMHYDCQYFEQFYIKIEHIKKYKRIFTIHFMILTKYLYKNNNAVPLPYLFISCANY